VSLGEQLFPPFAVSRTTPPPRPGSSKNTSTDDDEDDEDADALDVDSPANSVGAAKPADGVVIDSPKATVHKQHVTTPSPYWHSKMRFSNHLSCPLLLQRTRRRRLRPVPSLFPSRKWLQAC